jgi:gamma-glutamyltranspeptidase/glutathione hydrolase
MNAKALLFALVFAAPLAAQTPAQPGRAGGAGAPAAGRQGAPAPAGRAAGGSSAAQAAQPLPPPQSVRVAGGVVVSEHPLASQAGADVLAAGGNAIDAAIATGFALAVTHPSAGNIGGGGFMVIRFPDGRTTAIDFRETAPAAASPEMFMDNGQYSSRIHHNSYMSVGVPGTVAGFDKVHKLYGKLPWERLVYPALALADDGFVLSDRLARSLATFVGRSAAYPATVAAFSKKGTPYAAGDTLKQPDLAKTLQRIMLGRSDGFYKGETAQLIAQEMRRGGGIITQADLTAYQAHERSPITGKYRGYDIISMPPPSSGGVAMVEILGILQGYDLESLGHNSSRYVHVLAEAMRRAYADRAHYLADPEYADVPVKRLTSPEHAAELRATIDLKKASVSSPKDIADVATATQHESEETTQFSVVDHDGLAVSVTYTLEQSFGVGIVVPGAGFLLNNEMGDFNASPGLTDATGLIGTTPNLARPGQRMLSSMSPSILAKDGQLVAVVGSPGGRTIINTVLQVILNYIDIHMTPEQAVAAGRIHHQWLPDRISFEANALTPTTIEILKGLGHTLAQGGSQGVANSIFIDPVTHERIGVADPRNPEGRAAGAP